MNPVVEMEENKTHIARGGFARRFCCSVVGSAPIEPLQAGIFPLVPSLGAQVGGRWGERTGSSPVRSDPTLSRRRAPGRVRTEWRTGAKLLLPYRLSIEGPVILRTTQHPKTAKFLAGGFVFFDPPLSAAVS